MKKLVKTEDRMLGSYYELLAVCSCGLCGCNNCACTGTDAYIYASIQARSYTSTDNGYRIGMAGA